MLILEFVAMLTMLIDHIGITFFPQTDSWRIVGRIAFPIYCYLMIVGLQRTRNRKQYMLRLLIIALIAQVPYYWLFQNQLLNVVFTLLASAISIQIIVEVQHKWKKVLFIILVMTTWVVAAPYVEYGIYGFLLCLIFYILQSKQALLIVSHLLLNILFAFMNDGNILDIQSFSILGTLCICLINSFPYLNISINRTFYRSFYPAHMFLLLIISNIWR